MILNQHFSAAFQNVTSPTDSALSAKCLDVRYRYFEWNGGLEGCPSWHEVTLGFANVPLSMIGNVSSNIGILILQGENDSATPVEQGFTITTKTNRSEDHPDHLIITYPDLWTFTISLQRMDKPKWTNG